MNSKTSNGSSKDSIRAIVIIAFIAAIILAGPKSSSEAQVLIISSGAERIFQGGVVEGMVVLDALTAAIQAGNLPLRASIDQAHDISIIKSSEGRSGDIVISINATLVDAQKIHQIPIRAGDKVTVKIL